MRGKQESKQQIKSKISIETSASITDYQYNHNGSQLAVSDSDGYVYIYHRNGDAFNKTSQFRGDQAAIWKISWADPILGDVIAIGSFKRKVAIFQYKNNSWAEIAYHDLHQGSVNQVQWASPAFGVKLFSAGSDGSVAILELKKNNWNSTHFCAHQCSINNFSLKPIALNQSEQERNNAYPMLVTVAKDNIAKIWRHTSQIKQQDLKADSRIYQQVSSFKPHKEAIRCILWKKIWAEATPIQYQIFTGSQDGSVRLSSFEADQFQQAIEICTHQNPIFKISQSLTGNLLSVSVGGEVEKSYLYSEHLSWNNWVLSQQLK